MDFKCSVSSVLNKDVKQNGKQFMFDELEDTAWSSNEGKPQWIYLQFEKPQNFSGFGFQFQGGFAGKDAFVTIESIYGDIYQEPFYPEDTNSVQMFNLTRKYVENDIAKVKFLFKDSTDFFGRIIVYKLQLF